MKSLTSAVSAVICLAALLTSMPLFAQNARDDGSGLLYIIFDGSNSMWGELADKSRKITVAKDVFNRLDPALFSNRKVALRLYGHRRSGDCSDTELAVPFAPADSAIGRISRQVNGVKPVGKTPITRSLIAALKDFKGRSGEILLISDGIETCDADPCELVRSWRSSNVGIRVHVVGLGLSDLSRSAMQCIADASGTTYMDANSAGDLSSAIEGAATAKPLVLDKPYPEPEQTAAEFKIVGEDENGRYVPVQGTIHREGMKPGRIASNNRYVFDGGNYSITVGVPTVNGEIYMPVTQAIEVKSSGSTVIRVMLQRPPSIRTRFVENGEVMRGVLAYAYQDGKEVFRLRPSEDYFVMPGSYRFAAKVNKDNELEVIETLALGDDKDIVFNAVKTVHTTFKVYASGQDKVLRQHQELWQDGELKYKLHYNNGAVIRPGIYTLRSQAVLTSYTIENVEVPAVERQTLEYTVPFGSAKIEYKFTSPPERKGRRCWIYPVDEQGKHAKRSSKAKKCDGSEITLARGRYYVHIWKYLGEFEETYFDVITGQTAVVSIQQK
jgi:hypothetical protein